MNPKIALIGRPNVGKSTLLNRLTHSRTAITTPTAGTTRDLIKTSIELGPYTADLYDSGGIDQSSPTEMVQTVSAASLDLAQRADVVLLLVEAAGITADDLDVVKQLRPVSSKLILVVNKIDTPQKESLVFDFYSLGFDAVLGISAEHDRGIDALEEQILKMLKTSGKDFDVAESEEDPQLPKMTLLGRPNVGKSTMLNWLCKEKAALVDPEAGTTRDPVQRPGSVAGQPFLIVDTAGLRRKNKVAQNIEYYANTRTIKAMSGANITLLILDAEEGLLTQDKKIAGLVVQEGTPLVVVFNKSDLLTDDKKKERETEFTDFFPQLSFAPRVFMSAEQHKGEKALLRAIQKVLEQSKTWIKTAQLNEALREWQFLTPLRSPTQLHHKIKFMEQVSVSPTRLLLFVNRKAHFPEHYVRYLKGQVRKSFHLDSVPFEIELREGGTNRSEKV